jgi:hypothetical protein
MSSVIYDKRERDGKARPARRAPFDAEKSQKAPRAGGASEPAAREGSTMENAQPSGMAGLLLIVVGSLAVIVYVFLRIAGVIGRRAHGEGRPPPPTPMG